MLIMTVLLAHFFVGGDIHLLHQVTLILKRLPLAAQNIGKNHPRQTKLIAI